MDKNNLITLKDYNNNKKKNKKHFYYVQSIKKTLKYYNTYDKNTKFKKKDLEQKLFYLFDRLNHYNNNLDKIIFLQSKIRHHLKKKYSNTQGPGLIDKSKCQNQEDFYTLDNINSIEDKYFFSYQHDDHIFFFDIRSFNKLIYGDNKNPYTRESIPNDAIKMFNKRKQELKNKNIIIEDFKEPVLTPEQKFNESVLNVFQKIDLLNVSASGTNTHWFTDLNILQLKILYKVLEDVWNYRAELSLKKKKEIVPNNNMFPISVNNIYYVVNKRELQTILLTEMDKLVSSAETTEDKMTGAYFILTALVEVSSECMESLPWLIQQT